MTVTDPVTTQAGLGFELGEELSLIQDEAKKFADDVLLPLATKHDREERIGDDVYRQMGELGFWGLTLPEEFGGADTTGVSVKSSKSFAKRRKF